ncbi:sarcosine oxidase subunit gamma [Mesorhizobium sp. LHD-90]|uniref:sarcosine oxidase subunit gamma n=1 Tax=Mesorhizobium sp. LHD-90 TaxID=3071414 RepID=UPI0027DFAB89|nr:sarcosine oxidase subunit gamma [Mesorhizobium sp. LHD-90]MDQ6432972.1 sarcosine oxidase subunit gamma [Mesorhizobium sp. LHD-90]
MVEMLSPLQPVWRPGSHGNFADGVGVVLSETQPGSIVQVTAWPGEEKTVIAAIRTASGLSLPDGAGGGIATETRAAFGIAPGKFLVVSEDEGLADALVQAIPINLGTVTDLSHGRTALRIAGPKAEWVLQKFFAVDFSLPALPVGSGVATNHHDIFAHIQRTGEDRFDLTIFRSFARAFWTALCHASEEVGYEVR